MSKNPHFVFVYGTLQAAYGNNRVMTVGGDATLLGRATTMQKFYMASGGFPRIAKSVLGSFPASENRNSYFAQVSGELWRVDDSSLAACDRLEGHPTFYKREEVPVTLDKGKARHKAWTYIIAEPFPAYQCIAKNLSGVLLWEPAMTAHERSRHAP